MVLWHDLPKRVAAAALVALAACSAYVNGNGVYLEDDRRVAPFVGVAVDLGIDATVEVGAEQTVIVSGDANLVPDIETEVVNGILVTSTWLEGFAPSLPLRLHVTVPYLQSASATGKSHLDVSGAAAAVPFVAGAFHQSEVHLAGAGGPGLEVSLGSGAHLEAKSYAVDGADVLLNGGSAAELRVSGAVTGELRDASSLQIFGGGSCSVTLRDGSTCSPP